MGRHGLRGMIGKAGRRVGDTFSEALGRHGSPGPTPSQADAPRTVGGNAGKSTTASSSAGTPAAHVQGQSSPAPVAGADVSLSKGATATAKKTTAKSTAKKAAPKSTAKKAAPKATAKSAAKAATTKKAATKSTAKKAATKSTAKKAATKAPAKRSAAKKAATKAPAKKSAAKKVATKATTSAAAGDSAESQTNTVRAGEQPWTPDELASVRQELLEEQVRVRADLSATEASLHELLRDAGDNASEDQADAGTRTFEREQEMALASNSRDMLDQLSRALRRLDDGRYGICESCGQPIGKMRLQAFPRATLCIECKAKAERHA